VGRIEEKKKGKKKSRKGEKKKKKKKKKIDTRFAGTPNGGKKERGRVHEKEKKKEREKKEGKGSLSQAVPSGYTGFKPVSVRTRPDFTISFFLISTGRALRGRQKKGKEKNFF